MTIDNFLRRLPFVGGRNASTRDADDERDRDAARTLDPREEKRRLESSYAPASRMEYAEPSAPLPDASPAAAPSSSSSSNRRFINQPWRQRTPEERRNMKRKAKVCCKRSVRYLFFAFNVVLLIFGGALLGASVWIRGQTAEYFEIERNESDMVALLETAFECMLGVGSTFFGIALFGIVSECAREPCCLIVYIVMTIVFLLCQLIPVCSFSENSGYYGEKVRGWMTQTLHEKYIGANPTGEHRNAYSFAFDALNMVLQCCGVNNGSDFVVRTDGTWKINKLMEIGFEFTYPATCCKMNISEDFQKFTAKNKRCLFEPTRENTWMHIGCYERISGMMWDNRGTLRGIFAVFVIFQLVCIALAAVEIWKIKSKEERADIEARQLEERNRERDESRRFREERI